MFDRKRYLQVWLALLAAAAMMSALAVAGGQASPPVKAMPSPIPHPQLNPEEVQPQTPSLSEKRKRALLKYNFKQMRKDAEDLATLAKSLQEDLGNSNENVLSLGVVSKAERIEKLAKKIKDAAKGLPDRAGGIPEMRVVAVR